MSWPLWRIDHRLRVQRGAGSLAIVAIDCPICRQVTRLVGVPGAWSWQTGCDCFPADLRLLVLEAAVRRLADAGLAPCPQCNYLMENACGARCRACGFKLSCSGEP